MAVTKQAAGTIESVTRGPATSGLTTITLAGFVVSAADKRVLEVRLGYFNNAGALEVTSVTRDGQSLTRAVDNEPGQGTEIWTLEQPNVGSANLVVTFASAFDADVNSSIFVTATVWQGVRIPFPIRTTHIQSGAVITNHVYTIAALQGDVSIMVGMGWNGGAFTISTPDTLDAVDDGVAFDLYAAISAVAPAGVGTSQDLDMTYSVAAGCQMIGLTFMQDPVPSTTGDQGQGGGYERPRIHAF